ncbi:MAG: cbb3-type cytochrome c oxidase subunit I [Weeksellaceae bacterium]|jgi:nitric oxide reductase subunit B|nr:cbb3-type cytochrome c oxidase subunit I [Weeksellaceae bacterium]
MVQSRNKTILSFFILALCLLASGLTFGLLGALEYVFPGFSKSFLSFEKIRPLHVSSVVFWILTAAMGAVLAYVQEHSKKELRFPILVTIQFWLFTLSFTAILISYIFGIFGGREYWEFHPIFSIPIALGWILFLITIFSSIRSYRNQPVYVWMWLVGVVFFLFTYIESNLWWLPWFRNEIVHDMTIQWKSYGSLVGAWNMLIYGTSFYVMDKISGDSKYSHSALAFWIFYLGLFNGMFNWGHHIYTLPTHAYVKHIAYAVSMTELILFARIIYLWKSALSTAKKHLHILSYKFIMAADVWVFITLGLAIAMSIPALNIYMHGTHVIVGHTMGATIGINSMLLLSFVFDQLVENQKLETYKKLISRGYIMIQISLPIFFLSLISAGFVKGFWQLQEVQSTYGSMIQTLQPYFIVFALSGASLIVGFFMVIYPAVRAFIYSFSEIKTTETKSSNFHSSEIKFTDKY